MTKSNFHVVAVKLTAEEIATLKKEIGCFGAGTAVGIVVRKWLKEKK